MMIFVHVDTNEQRTVITQPSVLRYLVLRGEHSPTEIPMDQMDKFKFMLNFSEQSVSFTINELITGEMIKVIKGPLSGLEGELVNIEGRSNIAIRITQLGCAVVEINSSMVQKLNE